MTIGVAIIGAGRMGEAFAHYLAHDILQAALVAVADTDGRTAQRVARTYHAQASYRDYRALLERRDVEAVIVATPTNTHAEVIHNAAQAGKHIFAEKPLALTLEACDLALGAVAAAGARLQLGFMRRYDPAYRAAKSRIEAGEIGQPVMFKSVGRDPQRTSLEFARRENSGGLIMDMAIHDFDLARWLMGSEIVRVHSEGCTLAYPELEEVGDLDNAVVNLKFANQAVGNVDVSRNAVYGYDIRTEVIGTKGSLMIGGFQHTPLLVLEPQRVSHDTIPGFMERFGGAYVAEIRDFIDCIVNDRPPAVTGEDGRIATAIGIAATRSFDEGRPVDVAYE